MKRALSIVLALVCLLAMAAPALAASHEDITNSVVRIYAEEYQTITDMSDGTVYVQNEFSNAYIGSGFAVGKKGEPVKYFVTNRHVVDSETSYGTMTVPVDGRYVRRNVEVKSEYKIYVIFTDREHKVVANVTAVSDRCDLAIISLNDTTTERTPATIRTFDGIGDLNHETVYAVGFPAVADSYNNMNSIGALDLLSYTTDVTFTRGIVGSLKEHGVTKEGELIQHDAKISGGNSGGPLVDEKGYVLGVNTAGLLEDTDSSSTDYNVSVSSNEIVRFLDENKISYMTASGIDLMLIIIIAVAAVVVLAVIIILVSRKKGGSKKGGRSLYCDIGDLKGKKYPIKDKVTIGHDPKRCQIIFPENAAGVSGLHCTVKFDGKQVTVIDENSRYGTWIDNQKLQPGVATIMHRGQKLYLGSAKQALSLHN